MENMYARRSQQEQSGQHVEDPYITGYKDMVGCAPEPGGPARKLAAEH